LVVFLSITHILSCAAHIVALVDGAFLTNLCPDLKPKRKAKTKATTSSAALDDTAEELLVLLSEAMDVDSATVAASGEVPDEDYDELESTCQAFLSTTTGTSPNGPIAGAVLLKIRTVTAKVTMHAFVLACI
jgi:hypothetical protein